MNIIQNANIVGINVKTRFQAISGVAPYTYSIAPGGAGGSIDSQGIYTAPNGYGIDTIIATDDNAETAQATISIVRPLQLLVNVIKTQLNLADDQVYLWDQKVKPKVDSRMYVAISEDQCLVFSNNNKLDSDGKSFQYTNFRSTIGIDVFSRDLSALDRKNDIILALNSNYAQSMMDTNSFFIGKVSNSFLNLSSVDGAAIPYRFKISIYMQYVVKKSAAVPYYDEIQGPDVIVDP